MFHKEVWLKLGLSNNFSSFSSQKVFFKGKAFDKIRRYKHSYLRTSHQRCVQRTAQQLRTSKLFINFLHERTRFGRKPSRLQTILPCHKRSRYTWRAGWFQFSSPFSWGRHHNGSRICPRFRPSWCVSPVRNELREKTEILEPWNGDFATPSSSGASTRHSSTCPPSSPPPTPCP